MSPTPGDRAGVERTIASLTGQIPKKQLSWVLTLIEFMRSEWGCTLREALFFESMNAALVLWPAMMARHGAEPGSDFADRARRRAKERARQWIAANYRVV